MSQYDESVIDTYNRKRKYKLGSVKKYRFYRDRRRQLIERGPWLVSVTPIYENSEPGIQTPVFKILTVIFYTKTIY